MLSSQDITRMEHIINECETPDEVCEYCDLFASYITEMIVNKCLQFEFKNFLRRTANRKIDLL